MRLRSMNGRRGGGRGRGRFVRRMTACSTLHEKIGRTKRSNERRRDHIAAMVLLPLEQQTIDYVCSYKRRQHCSREQTVGLGIGSIMASAKLLAEIVQRPVCGTAAELKSWLRVCLRKTLAVLSSGQLLTRMSDFQTKSTHNHTRG